MDNIIFVLGGPGSGKGTQCKIIAEKLGYNHYSVGDLLRQEAKKDTAVATEINSLMKNGDLVPAEITLNLLEKAIRDARDVAGFLIDGFPRDVEQGQIFERTISTCKIVIFLEAPEEILLQRVLSRATHSKVVRIDDNILSLRKRLQTHNNISLAVTNYYHNKLVRINTNKDLETVTAEMIASITGKHN